MTPERMAAIVAWWVRLYTRNLPRSAARRRIDEIDADLHDHIAHDRARGTSDHRTAASIAGRMLRGLPADVSWRARTIARSSTPKDPKPMSRSAVRIAIPTAVVLLIPLVWMQLSDDVHWSVPDFVMAGAILIGSGVLLELAIRHPRAIAFRALAGAVAVAASALGEADDAPGLVLFGLLLILGTVVLTLRAPRRSE